MSSSGPANFDSSNSADAINPYAPTASAGTAAAIPELSSAETLRKTHLNHEASVKGIGTLYLLGAIFTVPLGILMLVGAFAGQNASQVMVMVGIGAIYTGLGLLQGYTGFGMRRLTNPGRIFGIVFGVIGLIGFPVGTLISIYVLYLLMSEKGKMVFSDHYRQVVAQTPHIKYKTSIIVWILLGIVLALIALAVLAAVFVG